MTLRARSFRIALFARTFALAIFSQLASGLEAPAQENNSVTTAVNIVFDCSGSMGLKDVPSDVNDSSRRGDVCRKAVGEAIDSLKGSHVAAGLVLFGHRSYWKISDDGTYTIQLSDLGNNQRLSAADVDPSFDVSQEIAIEPLTDEQIRRIKEQLSEVEFRRGAQSPSVQAIDRAISELGSLPDSITSRHVILVTDGINQLADEESSAKDTTLASLAEKLSQNTPDGSKEQQVILHVVLFGEAFRKSDSGKYSATETAVWVEAIEKTARGTGGDVTTAMDADSLSHVLSSTFTSLDSRKLGEITGEIRKNDQPVGPAGEFKVTLMEGEFSRSEPQLSRDGKFRFQRIPTGRKYSIKVSGRIRNRLFTTEVKDVAASSGQNLKPIKVDLE